MLRTIDLCPDEIKFAFETGVLVGVALITFGMFVYFEVKLWRHGDFI